MRKIINSIKYRYYSWRDNVEFERGYKYILSRHTDLRLMELHHNLLLEFGWERVGDVLAGLLTARCWYRKPTNADNKFDYWL